MLETANARDVSTGPVRKYEFVENDTRVLPDGTVLHRIRALVDIPAKGIKAGDLGGYLQSEENLSHYGTSWVGGDAVVRDDAEVRDYAWVDGDAVVSGRAVVRDYARVDGRARVFGDAEVRDHARVGGHAGITGRARVGDKVEVSGYGAGW